MGIPCFAYISKNVSDAIIGMIIKICLYFFSFVTFLFFLLDRRIPVNKEKEAMVKVFNMNLLSSGVVVNIIIKNKR